MYVIGLGNLLSFRKSNEKSTSPMFGRASHHGQAFTNFKYLGHDAGARAELESEILRNGEKW